MADYTGQSCFVCQKPFEPEDDVVVCPECGTPYHRACWQHYGHCINV
ncbi:MAG: RING finger protein, partial [Ruminococcus sp.]|nr:RING finger protein [Ruminococcus sp.]